MTCANLGVVFVGISGAVGVAALAGAGEGTGSIVEGGAFSSDTGAVATAGGAGVVGGLIVEGATVGGGSGDGAAVRSFFAAGAGAGVMFFKAGNGVMVTVLPSRSSRYCKTPEQSRSDRKSVV